MTQQMRSRWYPIKTAPRDGTVIKAKNRFMDAPVDVKWGKFTNCVGNKSMQFILVKDYEPFLKMPVGTLIIPTHWQHLPEQPKTH